MKSSRFSSPPPIIVDREEEAEAEAVADLRPSRGKARHYYKGALDKENRFADSYASDDDYDNAYRSKRYKQSKGSKGERKKGHRKVKIGCLVCLFP